MLTSPELTILRQLFGNLSADQKADFLAWMNAVPETALPAAVSSIESFLAEKRPFSVCPFCGSVHILKNGVRNGRQRFVCKDCRKSFTRTHQTILHKSKKGMETWALYINCMIAKHPLRKCARICGIHLATAFAWRHKILDALTNMMEGIKLDGVVECDETYELVSFKGTRPRNMPRPSRKRGGVAEKRGLSQEQVCITCGVNLGHQSVGRISNLGKPSCKELASVLDGHVAADSVMVTDSHRGYCKLADAYRVSHIRIPRKKHVSKGFNIQLVNSYHSELKRMINGRFKGVATKYLNNYVVYHNLVNFANGGEDEKEMVMRDFTLTTKCLSFWKKNLTRAPIPCAA